MMNRTENCDKNRTVEILAPAGSWDSLLAAVSAGADAVYIGGSRFGARAYADNLPREELLRAIDYVHLHGKKLYLTVNTLFKDGELCELYDYLAPYYERGLDAVIVQDIGAMAYIHRYFPKLPIHVSTQATVTSAAGAEYFKKLGAERIVPARELQLEEIRKIKERSALEIECFVHGALCYCYSGQCLMSSMIGGRSGNRGQCAQPCRLPYSVNGGEKQDILSLRDLCAIEMLPELIDAGIDSFKIEGRMKQPAYVYTVAGMYRKYADLYLRHGKERFSVSAEDKKTLENAYRRRGYTKGYYRQHNGRDMLSLKRPQETGAENVVTFESKIKEKFNGKLTLSQGESAKLYLFYNGFSVTCEGAKVQKAQKQPLDRARVEKQIRKTGATEFEFGTLDIVMDPDCFLPMQALNELRRDAISELEEKIRKSFYREQIEAPSDFGGMQIQKCGRKKNIFPENHGNFAELSALVSDEKHFRQIYGDARVDTLYVDSCAAFSDAVRELRRQRAQSGQKVFLAMPYIFRDRQSRELEGLYETICKEFDGVLVRSADLLQWLCSHGYRGEIRLDYNVYAWNQWSKETLEKSGADRFCAPVELNYKELSLLGMEKGALIAYGYQPVMITAGCIRKNTSGCLRRGNGRKDGKTLLYLTDRYNKKFPVRTVCPYCYNVIYNCQPLMLLSRAEEVKRLKPAEIRMDFLNEGHGETERLIGLYDACFRKNDPVKIPEEQDYTKGHFKRGVK